MLKPKILYKINLSLLLFFFLLNPLTAQQYSEWRGAGRSGVYNEKGLLKQWPENGPELLWYNDSLLSGYSSPAIANNTIYVTGIKDSTDFLIALDLKGKEKWREPFGRAWNFSFPESRCTPTVENERIFVFSGKGDIACIDAITGKIIWSERIAELVKGSCGRWGYAESLLMDDKNVFVSPGGDKTMMLALDKISGKIVWQSESIKDNASYTSPLLIEKNGRKQIINVSDNFIFGVDPKDGKIMWKFDLSPYKKERSNKANTPLYSNGEIYFTTGYDHAGIKFKLKEDMKDVELLWTDSVLDNHIGAVVKVGNYIYGSNWKNNNSGNWVCIDWTTGKKQYESEWKNKGSIISFDDMLILFEEKSGYVSLVKADPAEFKLSGSFQINKGKGPFWAHPVINHGILYIRHGEALLAYKIK